MNEELQHGEPSEYAGNPPSRVHRCGWYGFHIRAAARSAYPNRTATVPADLRVDPPNEAFLLGHGLKPREPKWDQPVATHWPQRFIQRVNTEGGLAPATGCDSPTDIGNKRFVPYKADYVFYKQN
jgi:Protein of unknown function (DUF3455)